MSYTFLARLIRKIFWNRSIVLNQKEIWLVNLTPTIGAEITKSRPCVIMNGDEIGVLPLKLIAPITEYKQRYGSIPWMVKMEPSRSNGLSKTSVVDLFQIRSVSQLRLIKQIGTISDIEFLQLLEAAKIVLGIY